MNDSKLELMRQLCHIGCVFMYRDVTLFVADQVSIYLSKPTFEALKNYTKQLEKPNICEAFNIHTFCIAAGYLKTGLNNVEKDRVKGEKKLKELYMTALEIHNSLRLAALKLADKENCLDAVLLRFNEFDRLFGRPDSVSRPLHVHYTVDKTGGGDVKRILIELELFHRRGLKVPESWIKSGDGCPYMYHTNTRDVLELIDENSIEEACFEAIRIAKIVQAIGLEMAELYLDLTMWRRIPCAMALHPRLGKGSWLSWLGPDLIQMVLKF